jgi:nuclear pore complex protein Nup155
MLCVKGTANGRVFMGGKDGCLYEFAYKAEDGWFSKKATKINHSTSTFSFLVPGFINAALSEEDPLVQLEVDDSRNILYARSEKGSIQVFDMGTDGLQLIRVIALNQQSIVKEAAKVALNVDKNNFFPIIGEFTECSFDIS